jgi:outer membrane protein assembly factor BamB
VHRAWRSPTLDGQIYAEPLVWKNLVIVATESDTVYGIDAANGQVIWTQRIGIPVPLSRLHCGNIDPEGVTATPAIDPTTGRVFVLEETLSNNAVTHQLVALDANTGSIVFQQFADPAGMNAIDQQERSALLVTNGRVYAAYGGLYGDCGSYHGWVVSTSTSGGSLNAYQVPTRNEGAIWAPGGPVQTGSGNLLVATGNGASTGAYDFGNSVIELTPGLTVADHFAPTNWAFDNAHDLDLGSTSPQLLSFGLIFQVGKTTEGYLLDANRFGGIGGQLYQAPTCYVMGGADAGDTTDIYVPCTNDGLKDIRVSKTASGASFAIAWTAPVTGSPIVAGGYIWLMDGTTLYALSPTTGQIAQQVAMGTSPARFATPSVGDGLLIVGTGNTVQAFSGT